MYKFNISILLHHKNGLKFRKFARHLCFYWRPLSSWWNEAHEWDVIIAWDDSTVSPPTPSFHREEGDLPGVCLHRSQPSSVDECPLRWWQVTKTFHPQREPPPPRINRALPAAAQEWESPGKVMDEVKEKVGGGVACRQDKRREPDRQYETLGTVLGLRACPISPSGLVLSC